MQLLLQTKVTKVFNLVGHCHKHPHGKTSTAIQRHQNGQFWNRVQSYFKVFFGGGTQSYIASIPKQSKPRRHLIFWLRILLKVLYLESIFRSSHISSSISALAMIVGVLRGWRLGMHRKPKSILVFTSHSSSSPEKSGFFAPRSLRPENSLRGL